MGRGVVLGGRHAIAFAQMRRAVCQRQLSLLLNIVCDCTTSATQRLTFVKGYLTLLDLLSNYRQRWGLLTLFGERIDDADKLPIISEKISATLILKLYRYFFNIATSS